MELSSVKKEHYIKEEPEEDGDGIGAKVNVLLDTDVDDDEDKESKGRYDSDYIWTNDADDDYVPPPPTVAAATAAKTRKRKRKTRIKEDAGAEVRLLDSDTGVHDRRRREYKEDPDNPGSLLCPVDGCDHSSESRANMNSHMSQVHRKILCTYCNKKISRFSMDEHVMRVHQTSADETTSAMLQKTMDENKNVMCLHCDLRVPTSELNQHIAREHCDGAMGDGADIDDDEAQFGGYQKPGKKQRRVRSRKYDRDPNNPTHILCPHDGCDYSGPDRKRMNTHLCYVHRRPVCPFCKMACNRSKFQEHIARKHTKIPDFMCDKCPKQFYNKVELRQHRIRFHDAQDDDGRLCRLCNTLVRNEERFRVHMKQCCAKKGVTEEEYYNNINGKPGPVRLPYDYDMEIDASNPGQCPKCQLRGSAGSIRKHFREAHARPKCPFCSKEYSLYFMSRHIATKHTQKLDFQCEICSQRFWKEKQLQHHKDEVHIKEAKFVCEHCGKAFHSQIQLSRHRTKHHNTLRHFSCPLCDKVYYNKSSLKKHIREGHSTILHYLSINLSIQTLLEDKY
jgi:transcriptional regulator NrdR family protein